MTDAGNSHRKLLSILNEARDEAKALAGVSPEEALESLGETLERRRLAESDPEIARRLSFHGVESILERFDEDGRAVSQDTEDFDEKRLSYLNSGETYGATLAYDHDEAVFVVGAWGDWVEDRDAFLLGTEDTPLPSTPKP